MRKEQVLSRMREECLIAVIRAKNPEQGEKIVEAVIAGGIHFIEITMTMDEGNPVEFISAMAAKYRKDDRIVIGAGTVLFCASGTGIYGSIVSGMTGDNSILIAKSVLDLFTAMIFACMLGGVVSLIAIPQVVIFLALFLCAGLLYPLTTPEMIDDFKAAGGFIMLATAFRMMQVKIFPTADMIPAMVLVFPVSWSWSTFILPLVS